MSRYTKILFLLFHLSLIFAIQAKASLDRSDTLEISDNFVEARLGRFVKVYSYEKDVDLKTFLENSNSTGYQTNQNKSDEIVLNDRRSEYWLELNFKNLSSESKKLFLNIANPNIRYFTVYQEKSNQYESLAEMGNAFKSGNKLMTHRNYILPLYFSPDANSKLLIKIERQWEPTTFPMSVSSEYSMVRRTNNDNLFLGVYIGIHLLFILTLFALYYVTKNNFFILYMLMNVLFLLNYIGDVGIGLQYIWSSAPYLQNILPYFFILFIILIHITFIRQFFNTALHLAVFNRFLQTLFWLLVVVSIFFLFIFIFSKSYFLSSIKVYQIINGLFVGYGVMVFLLCIFMFLQVKRKEIIWITAVLSVQLSNWIVRILSHGNFFADFTDKYSLFDLNFFESSLAVPHISFLLMLLEVFIVTTLLSVSFYEFIKDNSSGKYKLMLLRKNTINAYIEGQEKERIELKQKIHDELQQDIQMLDKQILTAIKKFDEPVLKSKLLTLSKEIETVYQQLDKINSGLILTEFTDKSLNTVIREAFQYLRTNEVELKFILSESEPKIKGLAKMNIYRMLQEIVKNISKHAQATSVTVSSYYTKKNMYVKVEDNGVGFNLNIENEKSGIGLLNLQSRTSGLGGELIISSVEGEGTILKIIIPISELT